MVKMKFGSHIYGTNTPESDQDFKGIYLPTAKEILMQKAKKIIKKSTGKEHEKNTAEDTDLEIFSIHRYIDLLLEGQTVALDMLFVPDEFIVGGECLELWKEIQANKDKFLHSGILSFIGYCRTQANKYGIKGSRMNAVKGALDFFKLKQMGTEHDPNNRLNSCDFPKLILEHEHINMVTCKGPNNVEEPHLEICNRKFGMKTKVTYLIETLERIYDQYGHRAKQAASNDGVDWKALMHAVRVQYEARELLTTGKITFPRPERELLLQIRNNKHKITISYEEVAKIIEEGLEELEGFKSKLPPKPDFEYAEGLLCDIYKEIIKSS